MFGSFKTKGAESTATSRIKSMYVDRFSSFFDALRGSFEALQIDDQIGKTLKNLSIDSGEFSYLAEQMLSGQGAKVKSRFQAKSESITRGLYEVRRLKGDQKYSKLFSQLEDRFGVMLEDVLSNHANTVSYVMKNSDEGESIYQQFKRKNPGLAIGAETLGRTALVGLLGPLGMLAHDAFFAARGVYRFFRDRSIQKQQKLAGTSGFGLGASLGDPTSKPSQRDPFVSSASVPGLGAGVSGLTGAFAGGQRSEVKVLSDFFGDPAYKARWTREVIDLLKKIANQKSSVSAGSSFFDFLKSGPFLVTLVGVVLSTLGGVLYSWLKDKVGRTQAATAVAGPLGAATMGATKVSELIAQNVIGQKVINGKPVTQKVDTKNYMVELKKSFDNLSDKLTNILKKQGTASVAKEQSRPSVSIASGRDVRGLDDSLLHSINSGSIGTDE